MTPNEQYRSKMMGWRDGAANRPYSIELMLEQKDLYETGYADGAMSRRVIQQQYLADFGATDNLVVAANTTPPMPGEGK